MSGDWIRVADALEIKIGGAIVARHEGHQIAVFRLGESDFRAVDNLCPHEGYPLVQGYVKECVLTCACTRFG
jgi:nitrite reductase/ring-hydroxylating ferredoxin subunit